jgi:hypothetical protein
VTTLAPIKVPVLLDKHLHSELKLKTRNKIQITQVISRLVEMYLKGEVKVVIPGKEI